MARKKIREYDSKRLLKEHFKRLSGKDLPIKSAQVSTLIMTLATINICCYNVPMMNEVYISKPLSNQNLFLVIQDCFHFYFT